MGILDLFFDDPDVKKINRECVKSIIEILYDKDILILSDKEIDNLIYDISAELELRKRRLK